MSTTPRIRGIMYNTASEARAKFVEYQKSLWPDPFSDSLWTVWLAYRDAFDVAPITTSDTPLPEQIEPNWWRERLKIDPFTMTLSKMEKELHAFAANFPENVKEALAKPAREVGERIDQLLIGGFALAAGLGALYIALNRK